MLICNKNLTELGFMLLCGFCFVAECILLLVVGSGQDTVRFSLSLCIFHAGRGTGREKGRSRNEKLIPSVKYCVCPRNPREKDLCLLLILLSEAIFCKTLGLAQV